MCVHEKTFPPFRGHELSPQMSVVFARGKRPRECTSEPTRIRRSPHWRIKGSLITRTHRTLICVPPPLPQHHHHHHLSLRNNLFNVPPSYHLLLCVSLNSADWARGWRVARCRGVWRGEDGGVCVEGAEQMCDGMPRPWMAELVGCVYVCLLLL